MFSNRSSTENMWVTIIKTVKNTDEIKKTMSIPISNAFVERVLCIIESIRRDYRNRMILNLVKAELQQGLILSWIVNSFNNI